MQTAENKMTKEEAAAELEAAQVAEQVAIEDMQNSQDRITDAHAAIKAAEAELAAAAKANKEAVKIRWDKTHELRQIELKLWLSL